MMLFNNNFIAHLIIILWNLTNKRQSKYWYSYLIVVLWKYLIFFFFTKNNLIQITSYCLSFVANNILLFHDLLESSVLVPVIYCFVRLVMQRNRLQLLMKCFVNVADLAFADVDVAVVPCCFAPVSAKTFLFKFCIKLGFVYILYFT